MIRGATTKEADMNTATTLISKLAARLPWRRACPVPERPPQRQ
jgi:hypothetical protein